jgi:hemerythrin superfamily protein
VATTIGEFIKRDHDDFRLMFERLRNSGPAETALRKEVYPFLVNRIISHHVAEEATIFPVMEKNKELLAITLVLIEEHRGMAMLARDLAELPWNDRLWRPRIFPFYDVICNHWEREETDVFPHAPYYFSDKELADTGAKFEKILRQEWKIKGVHAGVPRVMYRR